MRCARRCGPRGEAKQLPGRKRHAYTTSTSCALFLKELVYALMDGNWTLNFKQNGVRIDGLELAGIGVDKGPLNVRCGGRHAAFVDGRLLQCQLW